VFVLAKSSKIFGSRAGGAIAAIIVGGDEVGQVRTLIN
jgi:hypothetical protein